MNYKKTTHGLPFVQSPQDRDLGGYELAAPGAPEPIGDCGCGCNGAPGGCGKAKGVLGAFGDTKALVVKVGTLAAAYVAFKEAGKHKGGAKWMLYAIAAAAAADGITRE